MKPNTLISPEIVQNQDQFKDPFFSRFKLRPAPKPLDLGNGISKTYVFPTFYNEVTTSIAIFLGDFARIKAILPDPALNPVKMPGGRAVVILSCYEYKKVMNVNPYNEIAMTIPVMVGGGFQPPLLPLILKSFKNFGYYVFSMPVTSLENQIRGTKIWGLPKVVEQIDIEANGSHCTTKAFDESGKEYFRLTIPQTGKPKEFDESGYLYSFLNGKMLKSQTNFKGNFNVNMNFSQLWQKGQKSDTPTLILGDSPRAQVLKDLKLEARPFQTRFCAGMTSCFDLPGGSSNGQ